MKTVVKHVAALGLACLAAPAMASSVLINEISPNPPGSDPNRMQIELVGAPGTTFTGVLYSIETDDITDLGRVDAARGITGTFDANGLLVDDFVDLENPSFTLVLASSTTPNVGDDVDVNNDGIIESIASFGTIYDAFSVIDSLVDLTTFGSQFGGIDFAFTGDEPKLMFRDRTTGGLFAVNDPEGSTAFNQFGSQVAFSFFDQDPTVSTFGQANPTVVPLPAGMVLLLTGLGMGAILKRRSGL